MKTTITTIAALGLAASLAACQPNKPKSIIDSETGQTYTLEGKGLVGPYQERIMPSNNCIIAYSGSIPGASQTCMYEDQQGQQHIRVEFYTGEGKLARSLEGLSTSEDMKPFAESYNQWRRVLNQAGLP